jgi:transposase
MIYPFFIVDMKGGGIEVRDVQDWIAVKRLFKNGVKKQKIAEELHMSRNTVKRLIKAEQEPQYTRKDYKSMVDSYQNLIRDWYLSPEYSYIGTRIFRELKKLGYTGSISPVYRFLKKLDGEKHLIPQKATDRVETPPGDQAQFDWAEYNMVIDNTIIKVYCFSLILAFSRDKRILFSLSCNGDAIYEAIQEMFDEFGGITQELLIDNPKALVIENIDGKEPKYNLDALRMATHMGIELNACAPFRARTKGYVKTFVM